MKRLIVSSKGFLTADEVGQILESQYGNRLDQEPKEALQARWCVSEKYHLCEIPLDSVGIPIPVVNPGSRSKDPIIVELNIYDVGREDGLFGKPPKAIVIDGKHRWQDAKDRGEIHIKAYVGEKALPIVEGFAQDNHLAVTRFPVEMGQGAGPAFAEEMFVVNIHGTDEEIDRFMELMELAEKATGRKLDRIYDEMDALVKKIKRRI